LSFSVRRRPSQLHSQTNNSEVALSYKKITIDEQLAAVAGKHDPICDQLQKAYEAVQGEARKARTLPLAQALQTRSTEVLKVLKSCLDAHDAAIDTNTRLVAQSHADAKQSVAAAAAALKELTENWNDGKHKELIGRVAEVANAVTASQKDGKELYDALAQMRENGWCKEARARVVNKGKAVEAFESQRAAAIARNQVVKPTINRMLEYQKRLEELVKQATVIREGAANERVAIEEWRDLAQRFAKNLEEHFKKLIASTGSSPETTIKALRKLDAQASVSKAELAPVLLPFPSYDRRVKDLKGELKTMNVELNGLKARTAALLEGRYVKPQVASAERVLKTCAEHLDSYVANLKTVRDLETAVGKKVR
jgi:hypothetical protein